MVNAPSYLVVHCLWAVGRAKEKGYGSHLLAECLEVARQAGMDGVAMVSSSGNWLANEKIFLRNGFQQVDRAPPSFSLLVKKVRNAPDPTFPGDWERRLARFSEGVTVVYADQCPYMPDAVEGANEALASRGLDARADRLETSEQARAESPTAYGVFAVVIDGELLSYHYLGKKELRRLDEQFLGGS